jgi:hypothetical protein
VEATDNLWHRQLGVFFYTSGRPYKHIKASYLPPPPIILLTAIGLGVNNMLAWKLPSLITFDPKVRLLFWLWLMKDEKLGGEA